MLERPEDLLEFFGGNSDAGVTYRNVQADFLGSDRLGIDVHEDLPRFGELDRIAEQIDQHLLDAAGIAAQMIWDFRCDAAGDLQSFLRRSQHHHLSGSRHAFRNAKVHALQLQLARFDLGKVEDVIEQPQQNVRRLIHGRQIIALMRPQLRPSQQLRHADDAVHGGADFVAHVREERTLGAAGGFGGLFRLPHRFQRLFLVRDVDHTANDHLPFGSLHWAEANFDRKLGAVFADAEQVEFSSHRALDWIIEKGISMRGMTSSKPLRHQQLNRLSDQLRLGVAEQCQTARIGHQNATVLSHH